MPCEIFRGRKTALGIVEAYCGSIVSQPVGIVSELVVKVCLEGLSTLSYTEEVNAFFEGQDTTVSFIVFCVTYREDELTISRNVLDFLIRVWIRLEGKLPGKKGCVRQYSLAPQLDLIFVRQAAVLPLLTEMTVTMVILMTLQFCRIYQQLGFLSSFFFYTTCILQ